MTDSTRSSTRLGEYEIIAEIAQGGMGVVYLAMVGGEEKLVALKELKPELASEQRFREMFLDEARLSARLNHTNIVRTHEVGMAQGRVFIVMDFLRGRPLSQVKKALANAASPLGLKTHLRILSEVLAGLHYAHELNDAEGTPLGIIHRDVCPQNVFVTFDGQVKILDFGIAKARSRLQETEAGTLKGRIAYMAPEQLGGGAAFDRRADVFAVGAMLWEALTGARLWAKRPELDILKSLVDKKIPALPDSAASQPAELREMVRRATSADPSERYATAKEFRELIEQYLARTGPYRSVTDLGLRLRETFADDGEKLRRILEDHASAAAGTVGDVPKLELRRVPNPPPPPPSATASARDAAPKASPPLQPSVASQPSSAADASDSRPRVASAAASGPYPAAAARPSKSNKTPWVFAALGIALAGGAVVYATSAKNEDIRTAPSPSVGQSAGDRATSQSNVESEWVDVTITTVPTGATIFIDGQPAPTNPYKVHEKRGARHSINVQAPGYLPLMKDVAFDTNLYLPIALEVLPEGGLVVTGSLRKPTASASASASAPASPSSSAAPRSPALHGLTMPRDVPGPR